MKKIVLIDGHNLLFRMYYGIPSPIKNSKGKDIRGLIGFIGSLRKIVDEFRPFSLVVIFDSETSKNANLSIDNNYKSNRIDYNQVEEENNPFSQLEMIKNALTFLDINYIEVESYEADDYIASITFFLKDYEYIIVSTDSDFIQLVNKSTFLYVPRGKKSILYDEEKVYEKYHIYPEKYVLYKSLVGDISDNIKGVRGIGPITASHILKFNSLTEYITYNKESRLAKVLIANEDLIKQNIKIIKMSNDLVLYNLVFFKLSDKLLKYKTYEIIVKIGEN